MKSIVVLLTLFCLYQWTKGQTPNATRCPKGWIGHRNIDRCYYISGNVDTFDGANKYCKDRKSQLATPLTFQSIVNLIEILTSYRARCRKGQKCDEFWIGIQNLTDNEWRTGNGLVIAKNRQCQQWAKTYPRGPGKCGFMSLHGSWKRGVLKNANCTSKRKYVCITCPNGFDYVPEINECLYFNLKLANWSVAQKNCAKMKDGAHLMSIHDSAKQKAVENYMKLQIARSETQICLFHPSPHGGKLMWLGGQTTIPDVCNTPFVWKDLAAPDIPFTYSNFYPGNPNCGVNGENCAMIMTSAERNFRWDDFTCYSELCSICEF